MTSPRPAAVVILAAGAGTRMRSATPKVLHRIGGRSLLGHAMQAARETHAHHVVVVVRHEREAVAAHAREIDADVVIADQDDVDGTGRAAECALRALPADVDGPVLVTVGDVPLLSADTLRALATACSDGGYTGVVATTRVSDPSGYGRIVRDSAGAVRASIEEKDATPDQRAITEVNAGIYAFDFQALRRSLQKVGTDNAAGEKYLPDVLGILYGEGAPVAAHEVADTWQVEGVNDRVQLARIGAELNRRTLHRWMRAGVTVVDPATTWIDTDVTLGQDTVVYPQTQVYGASTIGAGVTLGPDTTLTDVEVRDGASVVRTQASLAVVGSGATVGPFAYLRPGTEIGDRGKVGTFVETKNADIAEGAKVPHLSYVGDASIGEGTNIGAGTIVANYDGVHKHRTSVGRHARTGANNTFVAPVSIGDGAGTGGGTVVRNDVPPGALAVSSGPQRTIEQWALRRRSGTAQADAARAALDRDEGTPEEGAGEEQP